MATTKKAIAEAEQAAEIKETTATPITEPEAPAVTLDELEGMDMNMFDAEETESAPRPVWRITDDDALLAYLKASGNEDMIQNTEKPKWGEFKKRLEIVGGQIVDKTTGELVEGVQIIEKPDTFTVDV